MPIIASRAGVSVAGFGGIGGAKGATVPFAPTIGTVTRTSNTVVSIPFTVGLDGGSAITSYVATSSPSITLTVTAGTSSPLTVTGTFVQGTNYTFTIAAVNAIGTGASSSASNSVNPYPQYSIGDTGPGGGKVFYDAGSVLSWGRWLEAPTASSSPAWNDNVTIAWSGNTNTLVGTSTAIGTGLANTNAMVAQSATANKAGTKCDDYAGGGYTDWFLPSTGEQLQLFFQRTTVGGFTALNYWSSTEEDASQAYDCYFAGGGQNYSGKNNVYYVRAIRAFS